jgi:hypothetical protein
MGVWFGEDPRTNTTKTDRSVLLDYINYATLHSEHNWQDLWQLYQESQDAIIPI